MININKSLKCVYLMTCRKHKFKWIEHEHETYLKEKKHLLI